MCELIQKWLNSKLGILIDIKTISFGELIRDGALLAELLHNYGVINTTLLNSIEKTKDSSIALKNLKSLDEALRKLGIFCSENNLVSISVGENGAALKLLYKLYLKLHNKNEVYFIISDDFEKKDAKSEKDVLKENYFGLYKTAKDELRWYAEKFAHITNINKIATEISDVTENVGLNKIQRLRDDKRVLERELQFSYFKDEKSVSEIISTKPSDSQELSCQADLKKAKEYVASLRKKHRTIAQNRRNCLYMHKMLLDDILTTVSKKEETDVKTALTTNLMKHTKEEKEMVAKQMEVQVQKDIMIENKWLENKLLLERNIEEIRENFFRQEHNVSMEEKRYKMEEERLLELHKRLYKEKLEQEHREHCAICCEIYQDFIDLTMKVVEYRLQYKCDVPRRAWTQWKQLFVTQQPLCDMIDNIEDIIAEVPPESESLTAELYRQNGLDEQDMTAYLHLFYPWQIDASTYEPYAEVITKGLNILGFIVHRLLLTKYPIPKYPGIPELPSVAVAATLNGVTEDAALSVLKNILEKRKISLVDTNDAINYCLQCYQKETTTDVDMPLEEETKSVHEKKEKKPKKEKTSKTEVKPKGKKSKQLKETSVIVEKSEMVPKETQTPKIFPCEEIILTRTGQLGKFAYETLNLGLTINNFLLVQILVEYLQTMKNIKGWILLNFPENINDAVIFELMLSGQYEVNKEYLESDITYITDLTPAERDELFKPIEDKHESERVSKLLPNTMPPRQTPAAQSYLTSYVCMVKHSKSSIQVLPQDINNLAVVQEFYTKFGINTTINYDEIDAITIKNIIAAIMRDEVFANYMYEAVIGSALKAAHEQEQQRLAKKQHSETESKKGDKKGKKDKKEKADKKDKKKKKEDDSKAASVAGSSATKVHREKAAEPEPEPEPEEEKPEYVTAPLPQDYQINLATLWENIEEIYLNDFKQCFFLRRVQFNLIAPYCQTTCDYMINLINKPDDKQAYLHQFQSFYNAIEKDMLEDEEIKAELHYRIDQFRSVLWNISFQHMRECEEERLRLIREDWFCKQACETVNIFVSAMQLELERYIRTSQLLEDYYVMMLSHEILNAKFYNSMLPPYEYDEDNPELQYIETVFTEIQVKLVSNMFSDAIDNYLSLALHAITTTHTTTHKNMKRFESLHDSSGPKGKKGNKGKNDPAPHLNEEAKIAPVIVNEWASVIEGEFARAQLRLAVVHARALDEINELLSDGQNLFHDIYDKISARYDSEISSIKIACMHLQNAVEASEQIQPQLILNGAEFAVRESVVFLDCSHPLAECMYKKVVPMESSISQILRLYHIFNDLAPSGCMPTQSFAYLLADMIMKDTCADVKPLFPVFWSELTSSQVSRLVCEIYGETSFVNWKDFLIFLMEIPFPTEAEILEVLSQFHAFDRGKEEWVNVEDYDTVKFWYENDQDLVNEKVVYFKKILRYMFSVESCVNYPELLLSFCKDADPVLGFTKAMEVFVGRFVCWNHNTGRRFVEFFKQHKEWNKYTINNLTAAASKDNCFEDESSEENEAFTTPNIANKSRKQNDVDSFMEICGEQDIDYCFTTHFWCPIMCYFLTFDFILNVLLASIPSYCRVSCLQEKTVNEYVRNIYTSLYNEETGDKVLAHEFLNDMSFTKLLEATKKFVIKSPNNIVMKLLDTCVCEEEEEVEADEGEEEEPDEEEEAEIQEKLVDVCSDETEKEEEEEQVEEEEPEELHDELEDYEEYSEEEGKKVKLSESSSSEESLASEVEDGYEFSESDDDDGSADY